MHKKDIPDPKRKNGCLLAWLALLFVGSSFMLVCALFATVVAEILVKMFPGIVEHMGCLQGAWGAYYVTTSLLKLFFIIGLFNLKKWGFYGYCAVLLCDVAMNFAMPNGSPILEIVCVVLLFAILCGVMRMGLPYNGWDQLD